MEIPRLVAPGVRFGEWYDLKEFITPKTFGVVELYRRHLHHPEDRRWWHLWDWVCRNIEYPFDRYGRWTDHHKLESFHWANHIFFGWDYHRTYTTASFWKFSAETLYWRDRFGELKEDCDGTSILLCSLLRCHDYISSDRVFVCIGVIGGVYYHAWVELDGRILETTLRKAPLTPWDYPPDWEIFLRFNDETILLATAKTPGLDLKKGVFYPQKPSPEVVEILSGGSYDTKTRL